MNDELLWKFIQKKYIEKGFASKDIVDLVVLYYQNREKDKSKGLVRKVAGSEMKAFADSECIKNYATLGNCTELEMNKDKQKHIVQQMDEIAEEGDVKVNFLAAPKIFSVGRNILLHSCRKVSFHNCVMSQGAGR
eukprot:TRINITY_DN726_c0_g1_i11.p1 TRINITY_DN726_c0_g1~~TRINITY_DN726_c0_g1_i11.p1  ORF type:complete len:135 (-),score=20.15 TRINITY_DN726_c0_g1_i11:194-598(-)